MQSNLLQPVKMRICSVPVLYKDLQISPGRSRKADGIFDEDSEAAWWADALPTRCATRSMKYMNLRPGFPSPHFPTGSNDLKEKLSPFIATTGTGIPGAICIPQVHIYDEEELNAEEKSWLENFRKQLIETSRRAKERLLNIQLLARLCEEFADFKYDFLYDKSQRLLAIGYNVMDHRRDNSFYDLLASESRLTIFLGIAQGKLPQESWFALGRQLTNPGTSPILVSWSGSMFEYLMPLLVMPSFENTLLDQTNKSVVQKQIDYGKKRDGTLGRFRIRL